MKATTFTTPKQVSVHVYANHIKVSGSLGTIYINLVDCNNKNWNIYFSLLVNALQGVSQGYLKKLKIQGGGYRVSEITESQLVLKLGYSHDNKVTVPKGVVVRSNKYNQLLCVGVDKQALSQFTSSIERIRPYNIYKKKGVFSVGGVLPFKMAGKPGLLQ